MNKLVSYYKSLLNEIVSYPDLIKMYGPAKAAEINRHQVIRLAKIIRTKPSEFTAPNAAERVKNMAIASGIGNVTAKDGELGLMFKGDPDAPDEPVIQGEKDVKGMVTVSPSQYPAAPVVTVDSGDKSPLTDKEMKSAAKAVEKGRGKEIQYRRAEKAAKIAAERAKQKKIIGMREKGISGFF
jgi:hypothetical protein